MGTSTKFGFDHTGIGFLLHGERLVVPPNQRSYAWEDDHVLDLFRDLSNSIANDEDDYFLGTIVLTQGQGAMLEVSDGQQRLATISILLAKIRDYFIQEKKNKKAQQIDADFLRRNDLSTDETLPRLTLNVADNEFFIRYILCDPSERATITFGKLHPSNERIKAASEMAERHIQDLIAPYKPEDREKVLVRWVQFLDKRATIVVVRVPDPFNAYRMFETLNDRGLRASQADILKNYFFSKAQSRLGEVQTKWSAITGAIETIPDDDLLVTYIRHFWITKSGPTKERELADKIKTEITGQSKTIDLLTQLDESAPDYVALFNADHAKWNNYKASVRGHVRTISQHLRVWQIRPLLFAVSRHFSPEETAKAFRLFVSWSVRFLIVGGRGGLLDRNYALRAYEVGTGKIKKTKELIDAMHDQVPTDAIFEESFSGARVSQTFLARYYLRALDLSLKGEREPELLANTDEDVINLEHIMPRVPAKEWSIDQDTALACEKRLGNMVLLRASENVELGNSGFSKKKREYAKSSILITKQAAEYSAWTLAQINDRQKKMAKVAVRTWPIDIKS